MGIEHSSDYINASARGESASLRKFDKQNPDAFSTDTYRRALLNAIHRNQAETVDYLLTEKGIPVLAEINEGPARTTPLTYALRVSDNPDILNALTGALEKQYEDEPEKLAVALMTRVDQGDSPLELAHRFDRGLYQRFRDDINQSIDSDIRDTQRIAIVGGGMAGTVMAIELLEQQEWNASTAFGRIREITIIEKKPDQICGGLAYGGGQPEDIHKINLQAERMSPFVQKPRDFEYWLRDNHYEQWSTASDAVPRYMFQEYLHDRLEEARRNYPDVKVSQVNGECIDVDVNEDGHSATLKLDDGRTMQAANVILASGHTHPVEPPFYSKIKEDPAFLQSQWGRKGREFFDGMDPDGRVFIVGTGMSAMDAIVSLAERGHRGEIVMMSRNGYVHPTYAKGRIPQPADLDRPDFLNTTNIPDLVLGIKKEWQKASRLGYNGEQILASWERYVPELLERFEDRKDELVRLFHQHKTLIDTNRIAVSHAIGDVVEDSLERGQTKLWVGNIQDMEPEGDGIRVSYVMQTPDGAEVRNSQKFDYVLSSLGQEMNYDKVRTPLWRNLREKGMCKSHFTRLGVECGFNGELKDSRGRESGVIYLAGVMRAGDTMCTPRRHGEKRNVIGGRIGPPIFSVPALKDQFPDTASTLIQSYGENMRIKLIEAAKHKYLQRHNLGPAQAQPERKQAKRKQSANQNRRDITGKPRRKGLRRLLNMF